MACGSHAGPETRLGVERGCCAHSLQLQSEEPCTSVRPAVTPSRKACLGTPMASRQEGPRRRAAHRSVVAQTCQSPGPGWVTVAQGRQWGRQSSLHEDEDGRVLPTRTAEFSPHKDSSLPHEGWWLCVSPGKGGLRLGGLPTTACPAATTQAWECGPTVHSHVGERGLSPRQEPGHS